LHYRQLDVTAFKLEWLARGESDRFDKTDLGAVRAWFPEARLSAAGAQHDAEYDLQASVAELAFYRARMLHP
jgi:oligoribonuclease (3'-5' exoribonuclease)